MMRVLTLTPDYPPDPGGIQLLMHRVMRDLPDATPRVVAPASERAAEFDSRDGGSVRRAPAPPGPSAVRVAALNAAGLDEARRFRPDVVVSGHIVTSPAARAARWLLDVPFVQYLHASEIAARPRLAASAVKAADAVVAVSAHTRELALNAGADEAKVHIVAPGVDAPSPPGDDVPSTHPTILTVSRLGERYKGHDVVIRALPLIRASIPGARWAVVGGGPLEGALRKLAEASGEGDAIEWTGVISDAERDRWFRQADVFVMPSRVQPGNAGGEGFGIVLMEAAAHGVPTVAGDAGGARDAVVQGVTGLLVDPTDHVVVAEAVCELLGDPERASQMGRAGAERAAEYSWAKVAGRLRDVLAEVAR
jgi:phosphatidylinositol alpha-1,6-mannosyltransferase